MPVKQATQLLTYLVVSCMFASILLACDMNPYFRLGSNSTSTTIPTNGSVLNQWAPITTGIDIRYEHWKSPGPNEDTVTITRFDTRLFHVSVGYQPNQPLSLADWQKKTGAIAIFNGGYFDSQNRTTGLTISNGESFGTSYPNFGGLLAVDTQGNLLLRSLRLQPYNPTTEQLQQATESSPMLVIDGKRTQFDANASNSRRTVVALDTQGRLLFIISPGGTFTLDETADLVTNSDLNIQTALNLDGGASTGMFIKTNKKTLAINSISKLPIVIMIK
jgi:uncharacterized protein YigE (DUF2233 family)